MDIVEKAKGFLAEPQRAFESAKEDKIEDTLKYYAGIAAIFSALFSIVSAIVLSTLSSMLGKYGILSDAGGDIGDLISSFIFYFILMLIGVLVWGAILHVFAYGMGGRKDILLTIKAVMYGSTPVVLLGWIPVIGMIGWIWLFVLDIIGIQQYQEITTARAIAAVVLPLIIFFVLAMIVIAAIAEFAFAMQRFSG